MAFQIIRNNIINVVADALVNTANPKVAVGPGVDASIYNAAGFEELLEDRRKIGEMAPGEVAYTPAHALYAKYIIHAIGPAWRGGDFGEREIVADCYRKSLALADELGCESIAFPLMATGTYGFPKDEALRIAIREISDFLLTHEMEVFLVVYDRTAYELSGKLFSEVKSYIEEHEIIDAMPIYASRRREDVPEPDGIMESAPEEEAAEYDFEDIGDNMAVFEAMPRSEYEAEDTEDDMTAAGADAMMPRAVGSLPADGGDSTKDPLSARLSHLDKTFQEYLFLLIDRRGLKDPDVYKKANIDRKHFSKIRSNKDYAPSKKTALALAIALELSMDEAQDLLRRAGFAFSPSNRTDLIIGYCLEHGEYDIHEINAILFKYDQDTLGV